MRIAAKFNGTCRLCQTKVRKGEEVDFESGTGITACPVCREFPESGVEVELCAQITQIKHQSERSNWGVVKARVTEVIRSDCTDEQAHLTAPGRLYSVAGPVGIPVEGEESIVRGRLILDPKWGMQIKLSAPLESRGITSLPALRAYLDMAPNIGPARTEEIIRLGKHDLSRVYALLGPDWEQLVKVKGITRGGAEEIHIWYERTLANRGAIQFLSAMELPQNIQRAALAERRANTEAGIPRDPCAVLSSGGGPVRVDAAQWLRLQDGRRRCDTRRYRSQRPAACRSRSASYPAARGRRRTHVPRARHHLWPNACATIQCHRVRRERCRPERR